MKNIKKIRFSDICGMLEKDEMKEILGGSGGVYYGSGLDQYYGGGMMSPSIPMSNSPSNGWGGGNIIGTTVGGIPYNPGTNNAGSLSGGGSSSSTGGSSSSSSSNSGLGWTEFSGGFTTSDVNSINRFYDFLFVNNGVVNNSQINNFVNEEVKLYGTVLNNVTIPNNYKGPSTIPKGIVIDDMTLVINTSNSTTVTSGNNGSWYAMPKYMHSSISEPSPLEAALMSKAVYGDFVTLEGNWAVSKEVTGLTYNDLASGFKSELYERTVNGRKEYCYATAGTELQIGDIAADILQIAGVSLQYQESVNNAKALKMMFGDAISFTGHSLGGGMAEANARAAGVSATTFNAAGLSYATAVILGIGFTSDTDSYIMKADPLNIIQKNATFLTTAGGVQHFLPAASQAGAMNGHSIDSVIESLRK